MSYLTKLKTEYKRKQTAWKVAIRFEPKRSKRFWMWLWYFIAFPFVWLFYNIRDWRSAICILISFLLWSGTVWVPYMLAIFFGWTETTAGKVLISAGTTVWMWWLSPLGSPFILLVTITGIGIKSLFNIIVNHKNKKRKEHSSNETENKNN